MASRDGYCRHCDADVRAHRPGRIATGAALAGVALGMVLSVLAASLIGPFIMFAVPFMALFGFALGPLAWLVTMPASCPRCRREIVYRHRGDVPPALLRARRAAAREMRRAA